MEQESWIASPPATERKAVKIGAVEVNGLAWPSTQTIFAPEELSHLIGLFAGGSESNPRKSSQYGDQESCAGPSCVRCDETVALGACCSGSEKVGPDVETKGAARKLRRRERQRANRKIGLKLRLEAQSTGGSQYSRSSDTSYVCSSVGSHSADSSLANSANHSRSNSNVDLGGSTSPSLRASVATDVVLANWSRFIDETLRTNDGFVTWGAALCSSYHSQTADLEVQSLINWGRWSLLIQRTSLLIAARSVAPPHKAVDWTGHSHDSRRLQPSHAGLERGESQPSSGRRRRHYREDGDGSGPNQMAARHGIHRGSRDDMPATLAKELYKACGAVLVFAEKENVCTGSPDLDLDGFSLNRELLK